MPCPALSHAAMCCWQLEQPSAVLALDLSCTTQLSSRTFYTSNANANTCLKAHEVAESKSATFPFSTPSSLQEGRGRVGNTGKKQSANAAYAPSVGVYLANTNEHHTSMGRG